LAAGFWLLAFGFWLLELLLFMRLFVEMFNRSKIPETFHLNNSTTQQQTANGFWLLAFGFWLLAFGCWATANG